MTFGRHFQSMCEYGAVHSQCRCPDKNKQVIPVKCNVPEEHSKQSCPDALGKSMTD